MQNLNQSNIDIVNWSYWLLLILNEYFSIFFYLKPKLPYKIRIIIILIFMLIFNMDVYSVDHDHITARGVIWSGSSLSTISTRDILTIFDKSFATRCLQNVFSDFNKDTWILEEKLPKRTPVIQMYFFSAFLTLWMLGNLLKIDYIVACFLKP